MIGKQYPDQQTFEEMGRRRLSRVVDDAAVTYLAR